MVGNVGNIRYLVGSLWHLKTVVIFIALTNDIIIFFAFFHWVFLKSAIPIMEVFGVCLG
jgi:hypothetical protein